MKHLSILIFILLIFPSLGYAQEESKAETNNIYLYSTDDYTDTITFKTVKEIQSHGVISIITVYDIPAIVIQQEEVFYIVIDNNYNRYGIHLWEYRHQIYNDLIKPKQQDNDR